MKRALWPLLLFAALGALLLAGLGLRPQELPSPLIDRPVPAFRLPLLADPDRAQGPAELRGQVWLLNVWASWCTGCRLEHPALLAFARQQGLPVYGLNYRDNPADARDWLRRLGDPYRATFSDHDGRAGVDLGVYGLPETYLVDAQGRVVFKHAGPLTPEVLQGQVLPLVRRLRG